VQAFTQDRLYSLEQIDLGPQAMNLVDMAINRVFSQKSDFHGNSDFQQQKQIYTYAIWFV
jgi:hypothetical protein